MRPRLTFIHIDRQTPPKMNNLLIFVSALFFAVCCGASPHASVKSQNVPLGIVNGTNAEDGEFPYVVQLYTYGDFACGGAILDEKWILTAGHCVDEINIQSIVYGTNALPETEPRENRIKVKKTFLHPKYYHNESDQGEIPLYDVGILELEEPIQMNDKAQPLKLAENNDVPFHVPGILAGWGLTSAHGNLPNTLQKVELQLLNDTECFREIKNRAASEAFNGVHNLCSDNHYRGQCSGDSGSPFVINGLGYGVVSWSFKPCVTSPGTYSRITNPEYRDFIRNITGI